ncbi:MAG: glycoside hydrolase family 2 protein, partial [Turicibacter sp.]
THKGGYTPFSVDITSHYMFDQENTLVVVVDSSERRDIPPYGHVVDYLTYGGIYREVSLRIVEPSHVHSIYASASNCLTEKIGLEVTVELSSQVSEQGSLIVELLDDERVISSVETKVLTEVGLSQTTLLFESLKGIELWDLNHPKRYQIRTNLKMKNEVVDVYTDAFGFREAVFKADGFYLNGKQVKLVGLNRHQSYPYVGYAMPERVQKKDADIFKFDLGLNIVRTSHYLQSRHFLDRCDEIGLLVFEEIPGWQHIGDEAWQALALQDVEDMIKRDYNRPGIILWGVRINESQDHHEFYTRTNALARTLDPKRQTGGVRYLHHSELLEDVYTLNDFVHSGGEQVLITQKEATGLEYKVPYLVTESNGHMYPTKTFDHEDKVVEHAMRHLKVVNEALGSDEISGSISWCAFDYNTHSSFGSGDKICHHGVMDMFRNKKYAGLAYASQKPAEQGIVLEPITVGSRGERAGGGVVPFTILSNCDYLKIYKDEELIDTYYPDFEKFPHLPHPPITIYHLLPADIALPISDED